MNTHQRQTQKTELGNLPETYMDEQAESSSNLGTRKSIQSQDSQTTSRGDIDISTQDRPKKISFLSPQEIKMKWMR